MNISSKVSDLQSYLWQFNDPTRAESQAKYLKNQFKFIGISHPDLRKHLKAYWKSQGQPDYEHLAEYTRLSFTSPFREMHHACIFLHEKLRGNTTPPYHQLLEWMITHQSWWDSVDHISKLCGFYFKKFPDLIRPVTNTWSESDNRWLIRSAIIFQLSYKQTTDFELLTSYILKHADSKEFFIQKAAGWALRNYSRVNAQAVYQFVQNHTLPKLTQREALRLILKQ